MTKDQGEEHRLENEEAEDVEAHRKLNEPGFDREAADDESDEVEGHMKLRGAALDESELS